jgi:alpha-ribazole phosphatase
MGRTLYLLRHGETGASGRYIGTTDLPLAAEAFSRLSGTATALRAKPLAKILCSPLRRCLQTAEYLDLQVEMEVWDDLREVDFGLWEGKSFAEISGEYAREVDQWASWSTDFTFPGGERIADFLARIQQVRERLDNMREDNLLLISHGGIIRQLICAYLGLRPENYLLFDVKAGLYSSLSLYSEGGILSSLNSGI